MAYMARPKMASMKKPKTPDAENVAEDAAEGGVEEEGEAGGSAEMAKPSQAKPESLEAAAEDTGENVSAKAKAPSTVKVRSTDDLRAIYKKKYSKSGSTLAGKNESYKNLPKQNAK